MLPFAEVSSLYLRNIFSHLGFKGNRSLLYICLYLFVLFCSCFPKFPPPGASQVLHGLRRPMLPFAEEYVFSCSPFGFKGNLSLQDKFFFFPGGFSKWRDDVDSRCCLFRFPPPRASQVRGRSALGQSQSEELRYCTFLFQAQLRLITSEGLTHAYLVVVVVAVVFVNGREPQRLSCGNNPCIPLAVLDNDPFRKPPTL